MNVLHVLCKRFCKWSHVIDYRFFGSVVIFVAFTLVYKWFYTHDLTSIVVISFVGAWHLIGLQALSSDLFNTI